MPARLAPVAPSVSLGAARLSYGLRLALLVFSATFRADFFTTVHWIAIFLTRNKLQIRACSSDTQLCCFRYPRCSLFTTCPSSKLVWIGG